MLCKVLTTRLAYSEPRPFDAWPQSSAFPSVAGLRQSYRRKQIAYSAHLINAHDWGIQETRKGQASLSCARTPYREQD